MAELNTPLILGDLHLKNRVVMAPLTRSRATIDRVPTPMMAEYYAQRASAGLIISEATVISEAANGYLQTPGLFTDAQVQGWKLVTQAVHEQQGLIVAQLWHVGRVSHPDLLNGDTPVSASAVQQAGYVSLLRPKREYVVPRPLEIAEIKSIVEQYKQSAIKAKEAGFDGVELHAANGYLIDQFLQSKTNLREDEYGGSVENRARLLLEVVDALIEVWGAGRVGVHLAPRGDEHDMGDHDPRETFGYALEQLGQRKIAFFFTREYLADDSISDYLKQRSNGVPYIANMRLSREDAVDLLASGKADAVSFGKAYIANPDLFERLLANAALNELQLENMIGTDVAEGYIDYPSMKNKFGSGRSTY
ncbi:MULTISPECIES: alkene reductase [Acinetobacter]|uniref:alkene reductase n=1 Tax=Acinetobacter TaxID=469 RepID=UPI000DD0D055|nr:MULTISPECIES: alkene reductase [Acinetobacter]MCL6238209.1 alkene reductase [Acinetobacter amyesii]MCL6240892.1 alkene reductase [Acinetobacter amyesii]UUS57799.1 alkene reductase [Acinetobacter sp. YH16040_T]UUS60653.1 alkene reductase [Acinetobacter sp. YH16056_T]UUS65059.1 alkene reductase [Acinetobacter sp. YH12068_T]